MINQIGTQSVRVYLGYRGGFGWGLAWTSFKSTISWINEIPTYKIMR